MKTTYIEGERIQSPTREIIGIADNCNGLGLLVLYISFTLPVPDTWKRKLIYGTVGLLIAHVVNILRCVDLGALMLRMDAYFEIAHHYIFKMFIYGTISHLWVRYSINIVLKPASDATE
ncbi:MAG: hypothetical protein FJX89_10010 [Bacteroidetes bacterium]|nr:hypothetical protein [Bacteroidota bacterium]